MNASTRNPTAQNTPDFQNSFALAIAVLRERIHLLCREDQNDLYELLPMLLGDDEEERESAARAVKEIFDQRPGKIGPMELPPQPGKSLENWVAFVSKRLREARTQAKLTQEQLAEKTGIPQGHISKLETGQHSPTALTLEKIAMALGLKPDYFDPST